MFVCDREEKATQRVLYQKGICVLACLLASLCDRTIRLFVYISVCGCVVANHTVACMFTIVCLYFVRACHCIPSMCIWTHACLGLRMGTACTDSIFIKQHVCFCFLATVCVCLVDMEGFGKALMSGVVYVCVGESAAVSGCCTFTAALFSFSSII